jgi:hypothetical protein
MIPKTALATITILLASVMLFSQVNDPWIGTWSLNVQKSSIMSFSMASRMVEYQPIPDGVRAVSDSTPVDGAAVHLEYAAKYDGTDGPIIGPLGQPIAGQTMAVTRFNSSTFETLQKIGRTTLQTQYFVSSDGTTLSGILTITRPDGSKSIDLLVFDRTN